MHRKGQSYNNADALPCIPCRQCGGQTDDSIIVPNTVGATSITGQSDSTIQQQQLDDPILGPLINTKLNNSQPPQYQQRTEAKRLVQLWNQLHFKQGILYCRFPTKSGLHYYDYMVVPKVLWSHILQELHEGCLSGHLGTAKIVGKLKEWFY